MSGFKCFNFEVVTGNCWAQESSQAGDGNLRLTHVQIILSR